MTQRARCDDQRVLFDCESGSDLDLRRLARQSFVRGIIFRRRIDSTNSFALRLPPAAYPSPLLILTEEQAAGRGRGHNRWWSDRGSLTFSLVLDTASGASDCNSEQRGMRPGSESGRSPAEALRPEQWPRVALMAAVAVCELLETLAPSTSCGIRWPNDVDLAGRKVCGILPELAANPSTTPPSRIVLGIGINLNNSLNSAPPEIRTLATSLKDVTGAPTDPTEFLIRLLRGIELGFDELRRDDPMLSERWTRRCLLRGQAIRIRLDDRVVSGACQGIDRDGSIVLMTPAGPRQFWAGRIERLSESRHAPTPRHYRAPS